MRKAEDLTVIMAEGAMRAFALHILHQGVSVDPKVGMKALCEAVKAGFGDFLKAAHGAIDAHMPNVMLLHICNVYCNAWAVEALKSCQVDKRA